MNMSHPNFIAFIKRFWDSLFIATNRSLQKNRFLIFLGSIVALPLLMIALFFILVRFLFFKKIKPSTLQWVLKKTGTDDTVQNIFNLLCLMENDISNFLLLTEECIISHSCKNNALSIGEHQYASMVLTPLIIDFGCGSREFSSIHYNKRPVSKPVAEQTADLLAGIKAYERTTSRHFFTIHPFMGINPALCPLDKVRSMLAQGFGNKTFSGLKLYPPLGFDPWPVTKEESEKIDLIYSFCIEQGIPLTVHCSDEGFDALGREAMFTLTKPEKWASVLAAHPMLRINLAHFGKLTDSTAWEKTVISLIMQYDNVYADLSYRGITDGYYLHIRGLLDTHGKKLAERLLYGSDYMMNLLKTGSYCEYLNIFRDTQHLTPDEKDLLCSKNPARFLFNDENQCRK